METNNKHSVYCKYETMGYGWMRVFLNCRLYDRT